MNIIPDGWNNPPALQIDTILGEPQTRGKIERLVVWNLLRHLNSKGWKAVRVNDGDGWVTVKDNATVMERVFNLDMSYIQFRAVHTASFHNVMIVLGNDGWDAVSDWGYSEGDLDGFNAAMDAFLNITMQWGD